MWAIGEAEMIKLNNSLIFSLSTWDAIPDNSLKTYK